MSGTLRQRLVWLAALAAALAVAAFLVAWSGLINVGASTGHWAVTEWALHFAMRRSVITHAIAIEAPPLDDDALVLRGAGHYATGCAGCHGAPGQRRSPVALAMTPPPPELAGRIGKWTAEELFWIVRNGVKMTAMPAWVAFGREDEVWSMVAFLLRLPELEPDAYRRLAFGEGGTPAPAPGADAADARSADANVGLSALPGNAAGGSAATALGNCVRCHGVDGGGRGGSQESGAFPRLSGQSEAYLLATLRAYATGRRHSGFMQPAAAGLSPAEMSALAAHYARAEAPPVPSPQADAELLAYGKEIALTGAPADGVPACAVCHGPVPGDRAVAPHPRYPALAGQHAGYLEAQLRLWQQDTRGGTAFAPIMKAIAMRLSEEQRRAVSVYYQSLAPAGRAARGGGGER